jgi:hypothetical protein
VVPDFLRPENGLKPVLLGHLAGSLLFYLGFFLYAASDTTGFLFLDHANLMIHEAGHMFFGWGGETIQILGGTLLQLFVPLVCVLAFYRAGETAAIAFAIFWGFENMLYIATYMGDARTAALPLIGSDESDWAILFTKWGVLHQDRAIAAWVRALGWIGMASAPVWLTWRHLRASVRKP